MRKWTWQWLVLLGLLGVLLSCCAWIDRQSYHLDEDFYKPSNPWKQMIWEAKAELSSCRASRHMAAPSLGQNASLSFVVRGKDQIADFRFQIADCKFGI